VKSKIYRLLVLLACVPYMAPAVPQDVSPINPEETDIYCQASQAIDNLVGLAQEGRSHIDRATFEFDALVDSVEYDADLILEFARKSIAFEQYRGTLRGPKGTLLSRAGNTLDQSLLLGKLLRDAGFEARIARTNLSEEQATALIQQMLHDRPDLPPPGDLDTLSDVMSRIGGDTVDKSAVREELTSPPSPISMEGYREVVDTTLYLKKELNAADISLASRADNQVLIEEAKDYFWVQYRETAAGGWQDAHPAFVDEPPASMPAPMEFIAGSIPEDLQHRLRLRLFIERSKGQKLEVVPISASWERPVANLIAVPLTISNLPSSLTTEQVMNGRKANSLEDVAYFMPLFNGVIAPGAQFFDLQGNIVDPLAASQPGAELFATLGRQVSSAVEGFGGTPPKLTAQWLELTLISPGGAEQKFRRTTFDRIGAAARAQQKVPGNPAEYSLQDSMSLLQIRTIMVAAGSMPQGLVMDGAFNQFLSKLPLYRELTKQVAYRALDETAAPELAPMGNLGMQWPGHLTLLSKLNAADNLLETHRIYRASPTVVIHSQGPDQKGGASESIDIVTNPRRAVQLSEGKPKLDPEAVIITGIWDTVQEGSLLQEGDYSLNTASVFAQAFDKDVSIAIFKPGQEVSDVQLHPDVQAAVEADLSNGFIVVVPNEQQDPARSGWWRIHLETGETVGQIADGRGSVLTEWITLENLATMSTYGFLAIGTAQCLKTTSNCTGSGMGCLASGVCCMTWNFTAYALGLGLAGVMSIGWDIVTFYAPVCGP